jgi:hypothetical protein
MEARLITNARSMLERVIEARYIQRQSRVDNSRKNGEQTRRILYDVQ